VKTDLVQALGSFLVGFVGWLVLSAMHLEGEVVYGAVFALGFIAGMVGRWPLGPATLLVGIAASYPVLLATGVFVSLGENFELYAVVLALVALGGFAIGNLMVRARRWVEPSR
jgi:hypothetical protein